MLAEPARGALPCTVEVVGDTAAFGALQQEWDELLQASDSACVFLTWEWLYTWWKHLAESQRLCILVVRRGNELVGVAPLGVRARDLSRAIPFPALEFLGSGYAGSDYLDIIARKSCTADACHAISSYLANVQLPLKWTNLRHGQALAPLVIAGLAGKGWTSEDAKTNVCPFIPLAGATWESYLASLGSEHRYNFNRKLRNLHRKHEVTFEQVRTEEQCREVIDVLIAQHNLRWVGRGGSNAFHTEALVAFHREWAQLALQRGWLRLYVLRLNGKPAACLYGFLYRDSFSFYQSSFDVAYTQSSVGLIAMGLAIRSAVEEGAHEYDLLHGDEAYKSHWSSHSRDLGRVEAYPPGAAGTLCRLSMSFGRSARALASRVALPGKAA